MLENNIMTHVVMAIPPWGNTFSFIVSFFSLSFFYTFLQEGERPLRSKWNSILDKKNTLRFMWNNSMSAKLQKEERTYNLHPYLNLSRMVMI